MIKVVSLFRRKAGLSVAAFQDYWLNKHGPFFMENAKAMRAKKYVQSHTLETPLNAGLKDSRGMRAAYDGVAEVWFESEADLVEGMSSPEGQRLGAALLEDEQNFIDHSKSSAFIVKEQEL